MKKTFEDNKFAVLDFGDSISILNKSKNNLTAAFIKNDESFEKEVDEFTGEKDFIKNKVNFE